MTKTLLAVLAATVAASTAVVVVVTWSNHSASERHSSVRAAGAQVMPFDLTRTTHIFRTTPVGGVQSVVAKDLSDVTQIRLIREHLRDERGKFLNGDFSGPMATHGMSMPGVDVLRASRGKLQVTYAASPAGASLRYQSSDPAVRGALTRWFDAQLADHGRDARRAHSDPPSAACPLGKRPRTTPLSAGCQPSPYATGEITGTTSSSDARLTSDLSFRSPSNEAVNSCPVP